MSAEAVTAAGSPTRIDPEGAEGLTVLVGAPLAVTALPASGLLLVVEADLERARLLKNDLQGRQDALVCAEVLAAQSGTPVQWFRFNDPRLDGPLPEADWREHYPNLRQLGEEQRNGRRLEDVLEAWSARVQLQHQPPLQLELHQGDPLAALEGLGAWLARLQAVQLPQRRGAAAGSPAAGSGAAVAAWLEQRGFRADDELAATWRRDPEATQRLLLAEREQQIAELEEQLATQAVRLLLAQTRHEELSQARDQLQSDLDALRAECHTITTERDGLQADRQELICQRDAFLAERDQLVNERLQLQGERDQLLGERDQLQGERDQVSLERDNALANVADLQAQHSAIAAERDQLAADRDACRGRAESLQQRLDQINTELDDILLLIDQSDSQAGIEQVN